MHIAAHGFEAIELFATRTHFDYHDEQAIGQLAEWLSDSNLELHSLHAPIAEGLRRTQWVGSYSTASGDETRRRIAVAETRVALNVARRIPYRFLVVHLGVPAASRPAPDDNRPDAARRSIEEIARLAADVGVRVAVEVIPNPLSDAASLAHLLEDQLGDVDVGVCLDYGHAYLMGDLGEAIETLSGQVWTTHVHDNHGRQDDHLVPFAGTIDWAAAMMETQKIGYDGTLMLEVADVGDPIDVLRRSASACVRLKETFVTF